MPAVINFRLIQLLSVGSHPVWYICGQAEAGWAKSSSIARLVVVRNQPARYKRYGGSRGKVNEKILQYRRLVNKPPWEESEIPRNDSSRPTVNWLRCCTCAFPSWSRCDLKANPGRHLAAWESALAERASLIFYKRPHLSMRCLCSFFRLNRVGQQ